MTQGRVYPILRAEWATGEAMTSRGGAPVARRVPTELAL